MGLQALLAQVWVAFHLIYHRNDFCWKHLIKGELFSNEASIFPSDERCYLITIGNKAVDLTTVEIGDSNTFCESTANKPFHALPAIEIIDASVQKLLVRVVWEQIVAIFFVGHRPVNQVQVEIVQLKVLQGRFTSFSNGIRVVEGVPHLARDEQILSKDGEKR